MKAMIMAGGTGGHIFPAAAVAQELEQAGYAVRWLGSQRGMESSIVAKLGFEFCALPVTAWHGSRLRKLLAPINLIRALWVCLGVFRREKPDVVIGFGGYPSAPGGVAAVLTKRPLVLHEQNGVPGLTNARLAKYADVVLQAFPNTFVGEVEVVGNPVRAELCQFDKPSERGLASHRTMRILILGGSQGAASINELVPDAVALCKDKSIEIWHQTGAGKCDQTEQHYRNKGIEATVVEFIDDMKGAFEWADFVIARSGASTVSELAAVGLYSLLIPYPWHKDRQQYRNAQWLQDNEAARWVEQDELTASELAEFISKLNQNRNQLINQADNAWKIGVRDSAKRIVKVVDELIRKKKGEA
jgi:UDP-N-acetylglucosamine--N-acetylmuramyl-(pentapeptide) pyrophosphoryl-undecaprenol N-acetylglucosamine transferase